VAWCVIDAVAQFDLWRFYADYRDDGHGRPAHDPAMMVALLLYVYAIGERSSRRIERRCIEGVAARVICANRAPDHTTIARFRRRHEAALGELFGGVLTLCAEAGLVRVGVIAVDGTKVHADASPRATRGYEQIAREILAGPTPSTRRRTSASVTRAATSCRTSSRRRRVAAGGCARPSAASTKGARGRPSRSRARAPSG
jgi:transposase